MNLSSRIFIAVFSAFLFAHCATKSKVESQWSNEAYQDSVYQHITCLAAMRTVPDNVAFEKKVAERLKELNFETTPGYEIINPEDTAITSDEVHQKLLENGSDAAIVFKLIGVQQDKTYNPPSYYGPSYYGPYYGGFYNYYYPAYQMNKTDGYWVDTYYYIIETKIYDVKEEALIWTAKTSTADPTSFSKLADSVLDAVIKAIKKDKKEHHSKSF